MDPILAGQLSAADADLRSRRADESGGTDACVAVGVAGQRDPLGVKCLHAHIACALVGIDDPIGRSAADEFGHTCPDEHCAAFREER